jgi:RNA polymerase sigma-70 factor (ECF subfamily)
MSESTHKPVEQELLIRRLKEGNESAYEVLFKEYYLKLVIHASKFVSDIEVAKEIVQDLFVSIYEKRDSLNISSSLNSYLYRAVQNRCINYLNTQKTRDKYARFVKEQGAGEGNNIESMLSKSELESALFSAISELPEKCRLIFKMNRFEGLSNSEIADQMDISKRTVETQISKALKILRLKLQRYLNESVAVISILLYIVGL